MGCLQQICPVRGCKTWNGEEAHICRKCGANLSKFSGKHWGIDYRDENNRRLRKKIGPSKERAMTILKKKEVAVSEGRHIYKSPDMNTKFTDLVDWYLTLDSVKNRPSYERKKMALKHIIPVFGNRLLKEITSSMVEEYLEKRTAEISSRGYLTKPATINRELACIKAIFTKAIKDGKAEGNPPKGVSFLKENNTRDRVLSIDEFDKLIDHCPPHLEAVVKFAYYTGMRQGEILSLTWSQVDLEEGFINLRATDTKTQNSRMVPLKVDLIEMLKGFPAGSPEDKVFKYGGVSIGSIRKSFSTACKHAGVDNFTFHDLRRTAINNWRLQGHDYFRIMSATGHKTMSVFKRYNPVDKEELKALVWEKKD